MTDLEYLNLANNQLNGQLTDMFGKLPRLKELNVENNDFSGWIPDDLKDIGKLKMGGNSWSSGTAPPPPPGAHSSGNRKVKDDAMKSIVRGLTIAGVALGVLVMLIVVISIFSRKSSRHSSHFFDEERFSQRKSFSLASQELPKDLRSDICKDYKDLRSSSTSIDITAFQKFPSFGGKPAGHSSGRQSISDTEFVNRLTAGRSISVCATSFPLTDLQTATANFAPGRLLGQGTIGRVYRAKYADGKVLAVKKIDSSLFKGGRSEEFSEIVVNIARLRHLNISELVGSCSEHGHNMLIYEYFRNGSLHEFLHMSDEYSKPLTWNTRVRIALGTARAVEYLHEVCSPSIIHKNIKSSNILLDAELNPRLSDCGLGIFHQRTSQNLGIGYNAPECKRPLAYTVKSDVYSFGVVMLELLTGRMPVDSSKPKSEQCLVVWAIPNLHDIEALENMVDPALRGLYPPKSVSRFADIIAVCVQTEPEFRPPISEVVQSLTRLVQRSSMNMRDDLRMDDYNY